MIWEELPWYHQEIDIDELENWPINQDIYQLDENLV